VAGEALAGAGMISARRLLARLRDMMARGTVPLGDLVRLVSAELVTEVCSVYVMRPGDLLELTATVGLNRDAVGRTRLRVGEGIIGIVAATGEPLNLPDAQNHPAFAYRPETGEEPYASLLAVPVRRTGRTLGVLAVQNRAPRLYADDEVEVLQTVAMLLAELLAAGGATERAEEGVGATLPRQFEGANLAPGLAIGPVVVHGATSSVRRLLAEDSAIELRRVQTAWEAMRHGLDVLIAERAPDGDASREVLEAYRLVAADAGWMRRISDAIAGGLSAEAAVLRVAGELRDRMRHVADPYLRERLADLDDLAGRLMAALDGAVEPTPVPQGAILLARRLGPAQLLDWHGRGIAGVVIEEGSPGGHAAILARALGLPALGGARGLVEAAEAADEAVLDADEGLLILRPEADIRETYDRALAARSARRAGWVKLRERPAITADGTRLQLMLNVGLRMELDQIDATGAEGIGLFRTEIAMLARGAITDVEEQAATYRRVLDAAGDRPVLFRTLDLGSDKLLPGGPPEPEENPAMGWRSLRIGLDRPSLLRRQLRALLLGAGGRRLFVMFPMVATVAEFQMARQFLLAEAARIGTPREALRIGTMLEVPALAWQLDALLEVADFVSIGSNDLMQFLFAADRGSAGLTERYDLISAPMLDLLEQVRIAATAARVPLSLCGEAAARPLEAMVLAALGITTLSMPASALLPVKAALVAVDLPAFRAVLTALRRTGATEASLRDPLAAWVREQGIAV
jgi:phosphotransferase system enzyme I (PtsP)